MNANVERFFEVYDNDPELRRRCKSAVENYPGSLECREYVVEDVLLPIAAELGFNFTVEDLRAYETKVKFSRDVHPDEEMTQMEKESPEDDYDYWLLGHGWTTADDVFKREDA